MRYILRLGEDFYSLIDHESASAWPSFQSFSQVRSYSYGAATNRVL
jgi:hypothetical protein